MTLIKYTESTYPQILSCVRNGGILAHPSDTCYGLTGDPHQSAVIEQINLIKQREKKPFSLMVADLHMLEEYGLLSEMAQSIAQQYFPGALTLVVPKGQKVPDFFFPEIATVGLRIPDDKLSLRLCRDLGHALITTSANLTGQPNLYDGEAVAKAFLGREAPDLVVNAQIKEKPASTVIQVIGNEISVLRQSTLTINLT